MEKITTVYALRCSKCGDVIFSRARHDFNSCTCTSLSIDGGLDYTKVAFDPKFIAGIDSLVRLELRLPVSVSDLYQDWNKSIDKWGKHNYYDIEKYVINKALPKETDKESKQ
jgi:hypothetical protein